MGSAKAELRVGGEVGDREGVPAVRRGPSNRAMSELHTPAPQCIALSAALCGFIVNAESILYYLWKHFLLNDKSKPQPIWIYNN